MASTQRPKFRTTNGCCICRRKSSSSRFAPSSRWEKYFDACFKLNGEVRSGLICNACVLIVKRYKAYLPTGQDATWSYVSFLYFLYPSKSKYFQIYSSWLENFWTNVYVFFYIINVGICWQNEHF